MNLEEAKALQKKYGMIFSHIADTNKILHLDIKSDTPIAELDDIANTDKDAIAPCFVYAKHYTDENYNRISEYALYCPDEWYAEDGWGWADESSEDDMPAFPVVSPKGTWTCLYENIEFFGRSVYTRQNNSNGNFFGLFVKGDDGQPLRVTFGFDVEAEDDSHYITRRCYGDSLFHAVAWMRCPQLGRANRINDTLDRLGSLHVKSAECVCLRSEDGRICYLDERTVYKEAE